MNPGAPTVQDLNARKESDPPEELAFPAQITELRTSFSKAGNPYFDLTLADSTGTVKLKIWNNTEAFEFLEFSLPGQYVLLSGRFFRNRHGLNVENPQLRPLNTEEVAAVTAGTGERAAELEQDWQLLQKTVAEMQEARLRIVCQQALQQFEVKWRRAGAARAYHHARRGGLLEHTAQMMRVALAIAPLYREVQPDLLCAGVLFHDIGKLWENDYEPVGFESKPSLLGEMVGHISIGIEVLNKIWNEAASSCPAEFSVGHPPSDLIRHHLIHLIASHHGQREFGAPVTPRTIEAFLLHHIDNMDAKVEMIHMALRAKVEAGPGLYKTERPLEGPIPAPLQWEYRFPGETGAG